MQVASVRSPQSRAGSSRLWNRWHVWSFWSCLGMVALIACATGPPPDVAMARATLALDRADDAQARQYAPGEYSVAVNSFRSSQQANTEGEYTSARRLAQRAEVEAQLAETVARAQKAEQQVARLTETNKSLEREAYGRIEGSEGIE